MDRLFLWIATGGGSGYLPKAPGTWGTLVALPLHYLLMAAAVSTNAYLVVVAVVSVVGVICAGAAEKIIDRKDPGCVVIDEIAGMLLALTAAPAGVLAYVAGFALFRFFDILKPFPVSWLDRHLNGGLGIMLDDLAAGLYAGLCLQLVLRLTG